MRVWINKSRRLTARLTLVLVFGLLALLLTACGGEGAATNNNFDVPPPSGLTELPQAANDTAFRDKILAPARPEIVGQQVRVYSTDRQLADVQTSYRGELTTRGWTNVTPNVIGSSEIRGRGDVQAFEKYLDGDVNKKHVVGIIALNPDVIKGLPDDSPIKRVLQTQTNVVIIIQGATGIPAPPR